MARTLPKITNRVPNPSAELSGTSGPAVNSNFNGAVRTAVWNHIGSWCFGHAVNAAAAAATTRYTIAFASSARIAVTPGELASAGVWVMTNVANRQARIEVTYATSANVQVGSIVTGTYVTLPVGVPVRIKLEGGTVPATAASAGLGLRFAPLAGNLVIGDTLYSDGWQWSPTAELPAYVDGSLGAYHFWTGAAHLSESYRVELPALQTKARRGQTRITTELWRATLDNQLLEDITPKALSGKVTTNVHNTIKGALALGTFGDNSLEPYVDAVAPFTVMEDAEGQLQRYQAGLFLVTPPKRSHTEAVTLNTLEGRDLSWILDDAGPTEPYTVDAGVNAVAQAVTIIESLGLRCAIPASTLVLPQAITWLPDKNWLTIVNDLLNAAGYYTIWATRSGILTSKPYFELASATPAAQLYSGEGGVVVGTIEQEGVYDTVANQIVIFKDDPVTPIRAEATNANPLSPSSTVALGRVRRRVIQPTEIINQTVADALALRLLEESASFTNKLRVLTHPLPERELHEVFDLAIYGSDGRPVGFGLWWCDGYELPLGDRVEPMTLNLKRLELYQG